MPRKLPTPCRYPGCPELTTQRFCPNHLKVELKHITERAQVNPVLKEAKQFYKSPAWRRFRELILAQQQFCRCGNRATMVDHIQRLNDGGSPFDPTNLQVMCDSCHAKKRQVESTNARGYKTEMPDALLPPHLRKW